jgi:hypothetical protein
MRLVMLEGLLFAVFIAIVFGVLVPKEPTPDILKPCVCPYKSATLCAIYCGIYAAPRAYVATHLR